MTQKLLDVQIDHFGLISFSGINGLVDAVGSATVDERRGIVTLDTWSVCDMMWRRSCFQS